MKLLRNELKYDLVLYIRYHQLFYWPHFYTYQWSMCQFFFINSIKVSSWNNVHIFECFGYLTFFIIIVIFIRKSVILFEFECTRLSVCCKCEYFESFGLNHPENWSINFFMCFIICQLKYCDIVNPFKCYMKKCDTWKRNVRSKRATNGRSVSAFHLSFKWRFRLEVDGQ